MRLFWSCCVLGSRLSGNLIHKAASRMWQDNDFQSNFRNLKLENVRYNLSSEYQSSQNIDFLNLLRAASLFSLVRHKEPECDKYHEAAFRIAYIAAKIWSEQPSNFVRVVAIILSRIGNFPTIKKQLANNDLASFLEGLLKNLPHSFALESLARYEGNTVRVVGQAANIEFLELTDFQRKLWNGLENENNLLSFSSPTSSGKTYLLQQFLGNKAIQAASTYRAIYVVPTRALITEIAYSLRSFFNDKGIDGIEVLSVGGDLEQDIPNKVIYVLPHGVIKKNVGVSPVRQQALYDFLCTQLILDEWIPPRSLSSIHGFHKIVSKILQFLDVPTMEDERLKKYAWLYVGPAFDWVLGRSLRHMINRHLEWWNKDNDTPLSAEETNSCIRDLFDKIENKVRFKLVKYINCYNNVLLEVCHQKGRADLIEKIPIHLPLFLEVGASKPVQIDLISLGLSRITQHRKQLEYIPTQIIAEYLREHFECDAIIYKSSLFQQTSRHTGNIVLFHKGDNVVESLQNTLEYVRHEIRRIVDVTYTTSNNSDF